MVKSSAAKTTPEPKRATGQRRRYTKTKFGCKTCKIRKVRCDETWPKCNNCKRTGRQCDGVAQQVAKETNNVTFIQPLTLSHFQPSGINNLDPGLQCMDVFRHRLVHCIMGDLGQPSWKSLMLQASHEEPSFCNAIVAFGALCKAHEEARKTMTVWDPKDADISADVRLAVRNYGGCIQHMQHVAEKNDGKSINVVLLCAIVCICFEVLMNSPDVALCHLVHSLQMLNSNTDANLALAFTRLDLQATVFLGLRPPFLAASCSETTDGDGFENEETELTYLTGCVFAFLRTKAHNYRYRNPGSIPLGLLIEAKTLEEQLQQFRAKHLTPGVVSDGTSMSSVRDANLRIKCLIGIILTATSLYAEEAIYDQFTCDFLTIVDCASELLAQYPITPFTDGSSPRQNSESTLDTGVIHPLYLTASKCRSSLIRRRAIELLRMAPSPEGTWDAKPYAKIAERLMELEEASLEEPPTDPASVPEWCRIHSADIYPQVDCKSARVVFRCRPNGMDGEWSEFSELITW